MISRLKYLIVVILIYGCGAVAQKATESTELYNEPHRPTNSFFTKRRLDE